MKMKTMIKCVKSILFIIMIPFAIIGFLTMFSVYGENEDFDQQEE